MPVVGKTKVERAAIQAAAVMRLRELADKIESGHWSFDSFEEGTDEVGELDFLLVDKPAFVRVTIRYSKP